MEESRVKISQTCAKHVWLMCNNTGFAAYRQGFLKEKKDLAYGVGSVCVILLALVWFNSA
jgi:hypothetical protein